MPEPTPAWAQGHDMAMLRKFAAIFAERHAELIFGQFGLVRERDIAEALSKNRFVWLGDLAAAVARMTDKPSTVWDFAGRHLDIPPRTIRIDAIAARTAHAAGKLMQAIAQRGGDRPLVVEIFEEDATAKQAIQADRHLDLWYWGTRIAAGSELKAYYTNLPMRPVEELDGSERASLAIISRTFASSMEIEAARADLARVDAWAQHYSSYNKRRSWTALALRGYDDSDPSFIIKPAEMARSWQAANPDRMAAKPGWTDLSRTLPAIMHLAERVCAHRQPDRVRLMRLAGHGELSRHADVTDRSAGVADGRLARLHLPIVTNAHVLVQAWDKRGTKIDQHWPAGALCYLDQRGPHRVTNEAGDERVHLVIDVESDASLRDILAGRAEWAD